jgi:phosphotransferase system HPr (HPr) family protein
MTLAAEQGSEMELIVEGPDEDEAMETLVKLFENKFKRE